MIAASLARLSRVLGKPPGFERIIRSIFPPEDCGVLPDTTLELEGTKFIVQPSIPIGWHLYFFGTYEPEMRRLFRKILQPGGFAIDIGANVGWHTILMASLVGNSGKVIAFEPNPSVRYNLELNIQANGLSQVEVKPLALSNTAGSVRFLAPDAHDMSAGDGHILAAGQIQRNEVIEVVSATLDSIVMSTGIKRLDLIKIDVEGFEWPVIQGAAESIARFRPYIVFEFIDEYLHRGGGSREVIYDFFVQQGYTLYIIGRWNVQLVKGCHWPAAVNLFAVPGHNS